MRLLIFLFFFCLSFPSSAFYDYKTDPVYLVSTGVMDIKVDVIVVYGYPDNFTPCNSLRKFANDAMKKEGNPKTFTCLSMNEAMVVSCNNFKSDFDDCVRRFKLRHKLLSNLMS